MNSKINSVNTGNSNLINNVRNSKKTNTKNKSKYTEDWIDIKGINNGMIMLSNNEKVTGVKVYPKNIYNNLYNHLK